jgi:multicomponent K+:H+ antiporter subunit D
VNHLLAAPVVLPALVAALALLGMGRSLFVGRLVSLGASAALVAIALVLCGQAATGEVVSYALGGWQAPFGIVLVLDRLSALMLLLVAVLALGVLSYAILTGVDRRGWHFHPLLHFQLLGLNGAFLTGDLFNLFVFFEILLIASYGLMLHGQGAERLKAGVQYVVINLVGSTLFLIGIGILYGLTGTLNMADLAVRIPELPASDQGLLRAGAFILVAVFGLKAALLPLHLWLPRTYAATSPAVAALFAIMTKVGVYSILRVVTLAFGDQAGAAAWAPASWMVPAALLTVVIGYLGVLAAGGLRELAAYAIVGSTGTLLAAVSLFQPDATAAAIYYLPHSTLAGAALFMVGDVIARRRPDGSDRLKLGTRFSRIEPISILFALTAIALVGLPPLSGFIGKLLILRAALDHPAAPWLWATILATTLLGILGLARAGSLIFWKSETAEPGRPLPGSLQRSDLAPPATLLILLAALTIFAGPATAYAEAAAQQLHDPTRYIEAVLGEEYAP